MNKSFLLFLWMRFKWITGIVILANIFAAIAIASDWSNWLLVLGCMMIPMITIGLGAGATRSMWKLRYDLLSRLSTYVAHEVQQNGAPSDSAMTAVQVFIRKYPWTYKQIRFILERTTTVTTRGPVANLLVSLMKDGECHMVMVAGSNDNLLRPTWSVVKRLMKICR